VLVAALAVDPKPLELLAQHLALLAVLVGKPIPQGAVGEADAKVRRGLLVPEPVNSHLLVVERAEIWPA
jgi:hypothetical protein